MLSYALMKDAMIVIAHGSKEADSNQAFLDLIEKFRKTYRQRMVQPAFLELCKPGISEAIDLCAEQGAEEVLIVPFMLFAGRHVKKDIPDHIQKAKMKYPALDFHYTGPLADQPGMLDILKLQAGRKPRSRSHA